MPSCSAIGCTNRSSKESPRSFHQIPSQNRNDALRKKWLHEIKRKGDLPKDKSFYICSDHFTEDCFERDFQVITNFICIYFPIFFRYIQ